MVLRVEVIMITERLRVKLQKLQADWPTWGDMLGTYYVLLANYSYNHVQVMEDLSQLTLEEATIRVGDHDEMLSVCGFVDYVQSECRFLNSPPKHPLRHFRENQQKLSDFIISLEGKPYPIPEGDLASCMTRL